MPPTPPAPTPGELTQQLSAPMGDLIAGIGRGVAEAQQAMDAQALGHFQQIYREGGSEELAALREIGYRPTWYQIPRAEAEIKVALTLGGSSTTGTRSRMQMYAATVDATYSNRYDFKLEASSVLRFHVVPIPAPAAVEAMSAAPLLQDRTLAEASRLLDQLGISWTLAPGAVDQPQAKVSAQTPAPGTLLRAGDPVVLTTIA